MQRFKINPLIAFFLLAFLLLPGLGVVCLAVPGASAGLGGLLGNRSLLASDVDRAYSDYLRGLPYAERRAALPPGGFYASALPNVQRIANDLPGVSGFLARAWLRIEEPDVLLCLVAGFSLAALLRALSRRRASVPQP